MTSCQFVNYWPFRVPCNLCLQDLQSSKNCIDLKTEIALASETSVKLPFRDHFSKDWIFFRKFFLFFTGSKPASVPTHSVCSSFPSVNRILPGGDHLLPSSLVLKMRGPLPTLFRTYLWLSA